MLHSRPWTNLKGQWYWKNQCINIPHLKLEAGLAFVELYDFPKISGAMENGIVEMDAWKHMFTYIHYPA